MTGSAVGIAAGCRSSPAGRSRRESAVPARGGATRSSYSWSMLSVSVLGPLRVSRCGVAAEIGSRRQRLIVAALAVRFPETVLVDGLVDAVWDHDAPGGARATLQSYVSRLRAGLGAGAIGHEHAGYRLHPGTVVDVAEVRRALADAEGLVEVDPAGAVDLAQAALARWSGPTLGEFETADWFVPVAVGLERVRYRLRLMSAAGWLGSGRPADAVELLSTMVAEDPLDEPARVLLVRALASSGQTVEATRAASRFRRVLREETGLDPSPELSRVEQAILSGELAVRGGVTRVAPTVTPPGDILPRPSRLIGRVDELAALSRTIERSRLVTILGTGGVGKTRLVAELVAELTAAPRDVVVAELIAVGPGEVVDAVAAAFGHRTGRAEPRTLVEIVGGRGLVVVLDNCERALPSRTASTEPRSPPPAMSSRPRSRQTVQHEPDGGSDGVSSLPLLRRQLSGGLHPLPGDLRRRADAPDHEGCPRRAAAGRPGRHDHPRRPHARR
jgi:DNA-binding SARP family transcriptional activator